MAAIRVCGVFFEKWEECREKIVQNVWIRCFTVNNNNNNENESENIHESIMKLIIVSWFYHTKIDLSSIDRKIHVK